nr:hypothetical protein BaRGS_029889 [Batillaria attramentaria]
MQQVLQSIRQVAERTQEVMMAIVKTVQKAVEQLKKADVTLRHLVSDLAPVNVTRILMLPNITTKQLMTALSTDPQTEQDLCQCVGATDTATAVARCLCADSSEWWERSVTDHGQDTNMTNDIYERLVARFCGPATSIEVPTVTIPRRCMQLRTETEAIAHTGLIMAKLTLYPDQVALINRPEPQQDLLLHAPGGGPAATAAAVPCVYRHMYNFKNEGDVETAVKELAAAANNEELYIIADEAFHGGFSEFVTNLANRVPSLHLWAAAVDRVRVPRLRARGLPVQVVASHDDEAAIRDVALATNDTVIVTDWWVMAGLERRIVIVVGIGYVWGYAVNPQT